MVKRDCLSILGHSWGPNFSEEGSPEPIKIQPRAFWRRERLIMTKAMKCTGKVRNSLITTPAADENSNTVSTGKSCLI